MYDGIDFGDLFGRGDLQHELVDRGERVIGQGNDDAVLARHEHGIDEGVGALDGALERLGRREDEFAQGAGELPGIVAQFGERVFGFFGGFATVEGGLDVAEGWQEAADGDAAFPDDGRAAVGKGGEGFRAGLGGESLFHAEDLG